MAVNCSVADDKNGGKKRKKTNDQNKHIGAPRDYHRFDKKKYVPEVRNGTDI